MGPFGGLGTNIHTYIHTYTHTYICTFFLDIEILSDLITWEGVEYLVLTKVQIRIALPGGVEKNIARIKFLFWTSRKTNLLRIVQHLIVSNNKAKRNFQKNPKIFSKSLDLRGGGGGVRENEKKNIKFGFFIVNVPKQYDCLAC